MDTEMDGPSDEDGMTKVDVQVPAHLIETIDQEYERRGYTSRSEAIRDALCAWIDPPVRRSDEILDNLATGRKQVERGETQSLDKVADKYGVDVDEASR